MKDIYGYTDASSTLPGYVNVSASGEERVTVSVRSPGEQYASVLEIGKDQAILMAESILAKLKPLAIQQALDKALGSQGG